MKEYITGRNPVYEVLRTHRRQLFRLLVAQGAQEKGRLAEILKMAAGYKLPIDWIPRAKLDPLSENHQGVAIEVSGYSYTALDDILVRAVEKQEPLFILILDLIQNPQNLGTLLRTAEAAGIHGVVLPLARAALVTPAVVTASAGASEHMLIAQANLSQAIERIKAAGAWVIGLEGCSSAQLPEQVRLDGPLALVVGNEGEGLRALVRSSCDVLLRLPMHGEVESLNAAVAGSIAVYLALQARQDAQKAKTEKPVI